MTTLKTAVASTSVEVNVYCPYCDCYQDIFGYKHDCFDDIRDEFNFRGEMRSDDCEIEVECEQCKERFIVNEIEY